MTEEEDLVEAESFPTEAEAMAAAASLRARGIRCVIARQDPSGAAALTRVAAGQSILVAADDVLEARELVEHASEEKEGLNPTTKPNVGSGDVQFTSGLLDIRRKRRRFWLLAATYLPVGGFAMWAAPGAAPYVAGLWMAALAVTAIRAGNARRPRCGNRYSQRRVGGNPWTQRCLYCDSPLNAGDPGP